MRRVIQVAEWGRLSLPSDHDNLAVKSQLVRKGRTAFGDALVLRGRHVYAQDLAGIIDAGKFQIQIVPKVYSDSTAQQDATLLLELFALSASSGDVAIMPAATSTQRATVLEPLVWHYANSLNRQLRLAEIPRRYEMRAEESPTLRGRVNLSRLARAGAVYTNRLPIVHYPLQDDNALTRLLRSLALDLVKYAATARTKASLHDSAALLQHARNEQLQPSLLSQAKLTRFEKVWSPFVELAEFLVTGRLPNPVKPGENTSAGFLLPLDRLFESALRVTLRKAAQVTRVHVSENRGGLRFLREFNGSREILSLKPDIVFRYEMGQPAVIGDAKWKRLKPERPNLGLSANDLYQVAAYIQRYSVRHGALFYPGADPISTTWRSYSWRLLGAPNHLIDIIEIDTAKLLSAVKPPVNASVVADLSKLVTFLAMDRELSESLVGCPRQ